MNMRAIIAALALCAAAGSSAAQQVYRCDAAGKISYQDTPCANGVSTKLPMPALPPADPAVQAQRDHERELADSLGKQRMAREAQEAREQARSGHGLAAAGKDSNTRRSTRERVPKAPKMAKAPKAAPKALQRAAKRV
jgi:hypothetical protein